MSSGFLYLRLCPFCPSEAVDYARFAQLGLRFGHQHTGRWFCTRPVDDRFAILTRAASSSRTATHQKVFRSYLFARPARPRSLYRVITMSSGSEASPTGEKYSTKLPAVHSNEHVPGHRNYFEKDGLRTYGDDEDHEHEPAVRGIIAYLLPRLTGEVDVLQEDHVADRYGLPLDWLADPCLHLWWLSPAPMFRQRA